MAGLPGVRACSFAGLNIEVASLKWLCSLDASEALLIIFVGPVEGNSGNKTSVIATFHTRHLIFDPHAWTEPYMIVK